MHIQKSVFSVLPTNAHDTSHQPAVTALVSWTVNVYSCCCLVFLLGRGICIFLPCYSCRACLSGAAEQPVVSALAQAHQIHSDINTVTLSTGYS